MISTRRGCQLTDSFLMGGDFGWFCPHCPTVVIDPAAVGAQLARSLPRWDVGSEFAVLGLVNLDAVPPSKQHLPLGGDDNPVPLVEFTRVIGPPIADRSTRPVAPRPARNGRSLRRRGKKRRSR